VCRRHSDAELVLLTSRSSQRSYDHAIHKFIEWYCSEPRLAFIKTVVTRYRISLGQARCASSTLNLRLAAVRRLACEAADSGLLSPEVGKASDFGSCPHHRSGLGGDRFLKTDCGRVITIETEIGLIYP
jgi:hypothetical protein